MTTAEHPAPAWLDGAAAALMLSFDVDAESCVLAEGEHYRRHPGALSHQAYGPQVGVPRILELLADLNVQATFFVPGRTADTWPHVVESIVEAGHEVAHHSYAHRRLVTMTEAEEIEDLERGLASLDALGIRPVGHRSPLSAPSLRTAGLLARYGFAYQSTLMNDDRPYLLSTAHGMLAELPPSWLLDDFAQFAFVPDPPLGSAMQAPGRALEVWGAELQAARDYGALCVLCAHPFLSGRPSRVKALRTLIGAALDQGDIAVLTGAQLAERVHHDPGITIRPEPVEFGTTAKTPQTPAPFTSGEIHA
ncbi:polysaccharide deacetylase [Streptomyces sp. NPDC056352]|uniref:polysaccharide deacetylase family protein n=1 Tax=Streptomyces sp. NPDC056352 TaxID=3345791 RepID=UPI0035E2A1EC